MRKYAYLKKPLKIDKNNSVVKIMFYEDTQGVGLFEYLDDDAIFSAADLFYESSEELHEEWDDQIDERGWIDLNDPLPGCQHDTFLPLRVKGRDSGRPEWGKYEILTDEGWKDFIV